ncbi:hypothetical protein A3B57_00670 [Microgenomates group bacterium RIFCSPLOWO2_01_FULL_47_10]|nr:MAG: hypothetical protein A3B57_00670 [Microgenomates group bacterium RIFCSPLOWO2_01_FULL_47_10]
MMNQYKSVYLIRHGENEINLNDPGLTDYGKIQANKITFTKHQVDGIVTSPTKRTLETAQVISKSIGVPYQIENLINERLDFLDVPQLNYPQFRKLCAASTNDRDYVLPNGQSSYTSGLRLEYFMTYVANIVSNGAIIVTHQGIISDYLRNKFSDVEIERICPLFNETREDTIANCSITQVDIFGKDHQLRYIGCTSHLS